jgi:hypothetical protein
MKGLEALPPLGAEVIVWRGVSRCGVLLQPITHDLA